jgi:hypothetical protein
VNQTPLSIVVQPANIWWIDITAQPQWNLRQLCELSLPQVLKHSAKKRFTGVGIFIIYRDGMGNRLSQMVYIT